MSKLAVFFVVFSSSLAAVEIDGRWFSPTDSHHPQHAAAGAGIGAGMRLVLEPIAPGEYRLAKWIVATGTACATQVLWEYLAEKQGGAVFDPADVAWGTLGGGAGAGAADLGITGVRWLLAARRDGVALSLEWRH